MKQKFFFLNSLVVLFACVITITSCGSDDETHSTSGPYGYDFSAKNDVGVTLFYKFSTMDYNEVVLVSPSAGYYKGDIRIPPEVTYKGNVYRVTSIGESTFRQSQLTSVTIPYGVTSIEDKAFYGCIELTSIVIPNSVTKIGNSAFHLCWGATSLTLGNSVTSIGDDAFTCCSFESIEIPGSVKEMGRNCFSKNDGLKSVTILNGVTKIGNCAFDNCSNLKSVTIPNSVTELGDYAFVDCESLVSITIPNNVTTIGNYAFEGCSTLESITIPNSVKELGDYAFRGCTSLTKIYSHITEPFPINEYGMNIEDHVTLFVPLGTKSKYKSTQGWKKFTSIEEIEY